MTTESRDERTNNEPRYIISIAARMVGVRPHTLRYYEKIGIIVPSRSRGKLRLYSDLDVEQVRRAKSLMDELGVSLAGVEIIFRMAKQMTELQKQLEETEAWLRQLTGEES